MTNQPPPLDAERVSDADLSPCPFCGNEHPSKYWVNGLARKHPMAYIECNLGECAARSGEFDTMPRAIAAWNLRATQRESGGEWIDAETCRPEPEVLVLCWDGQRTFVDWFGSKHPREFGVTHWMPYRLPPGCTSDMHDGRRALSASQRKECETFFRVEVSDHAGQIVAIEPATLCGRDIGDDERAKIHMAIENLRGFIGTGQRKETP